jgi:hypothetical protein
MTTLFSRIIAFVPSNTITRNKEFLSRLAAKVREADRIERLRQQEVPEGPFLQGGSGISLSASTNSRRSRSRPATR